MKIKKLTVWLCILGLTVMLGCASFQDAITPCYIEPATLKYADANATTFLPFTTLFDAERVDRKMDFVHQWNQTKDNMQYGFLKGLNAFHIGAAEEFQTALFSPEGPIGLMLPTVMGGTLGALLISKPDDKKKIVELEKKNGNSS